MENEKVLQVLSIIAKNLNGTRNVTDYTSSQGASAALNALYYLGFYKPGANEEIEAHKACIAALNSAVELNNKFNDKLQKAYTNPSEAPIAVQHALELFLVKVGY